VGIIYDRIRWEEKDLLRAFEERGVKPLLIDAKNIVEDVTSHDGSSFPKVNMNRCISFYRGEFVASILENCEVGVVNSCSVLHTCGNKLLTTEALVKNGVPTPKTLVAFSPESAVECANNIGYPCVMKPIIGSWGRMVVKLLDEDSARSFIEMRESAGDGIQQTVFYIQEFIQRPPRDIRCIVVGDEIVASVYRYAANGSWKTNVALGGKSEKCPMTKDLEDVVMATSKAVGGGILGVDAMEATAGRLLVHEVNGTVEFRGAASVSERDIASAMTDFVLANGV
jgi:[lysine-biosynthesis-protein LysW]--L-2-aminoadipate ligase